MAAAVPVADFQAELAASLAEAPSDVVPPAAVAAPVAAQVVNGPIEGQDTGIAEAMDDDGGAGV